MPFTLCVVGGDDTLSSYAIGLAEGVGFRIDCREADVLLVLGSFEARLAAKPRVVVACGAEAIRSIAGLVERGSVMAATPELMIELGEKGFIPVPKPLVVYFNIVTCIERDVLPEAVRVAKRIVECQVLGRCLPPFTRMKLEAVKRRGAADPVVHEA